MFNAAINVRYRLEKPPCYQNGESCKKRHAGCHAGCKEFKEYRQRLEEEKRKTIRAVNGEKAADEFRISSTFKNRKGKQKQV